MIGSALGSTKVLCNKTWLIVPIAVTLQLAIIFTLVQSFFLLAELNLGLLLANCSVNASEGYSERSAMGAASGDSSAWLSCCSSRFVSGPSPR